MPIRIYWETDDRTALIVEHSVQVSLSESSAALNEIQRLVLVSPHKITLIYLFPEHFLPPLGSLRISLKMFVWFTTHMAQFEHIVFVNVHFLLSSFGMWLYKMYSPPHFDKYIRVESLDEWQQYAVYAHTTP